MDRVTLFLAVGEFVKRKHVDAGWDPSRIHVKSNFCRPIPSRDGPGEFFLYVGRLSTEKGLEGLLRSWPEGTPLRLVGDGPERGRLERLAPASVKFEGAVPGTEVASHIRGARALILPSICYEGQPRVVLEAFAAGVPVIASALGGIVDLVESGKNGLLPTPGSPRSWLSAIEALADDARSHAMGAAALERWQELYSPERGLADLETAYRSVIQLARREQRGPSDG
jgi:glycosyltransferase involved in cell wall biosynthesis